MVLMFKRLDPKASLPKYAHASDSGMDVSTIESGTILPHSFAKFKTGLAAVIPPGYELQVRPRSGLQCKSGIVGAWGTVDEGYRGDIGVALYNHSDEPFHVSVGDRIAQLVLSPVVRPAVYETFEELADTDRGSAGFGSTGIGNSATHDAPKVCGNNNCIDNTPYYALPCGKQLEDFIWEMELDFFWGSAIKYAWRAGKKDGESTDKDTKKKLHYVRLLSAKFAMPESAILVHLKALCDGAKGWDGTRIRNCQYALPAE